MINPGDVFISIAVNPRRRRNRRQLRVKWSAEMSEDLAAFFGLDLIPDVFLFPESDVEKHMVVFLCYSKEEGTGVFINCEGETKEINLSLFENEVFGKLMNKMEPEENDE